MCSFVLSVACFFIFSPSCTLNICLPYDACTAHVTIILFCSRMHKGWLCRSGPEDGGIDVRASLFVSKFHFSKLNIICFYERKGVLATRTLRWPAILYRLPLCHTRTSGGSSGHGLMAVLGFSCESAVPARTDTHQTCTRDHTHARARVCLPLDMHAHTRTPQVDLQHGRPVACGAPLSLCAFTRVWVGARCACADTCLLCPSRDTQPETPTRVCPFVWHCARTCAACTALGPHLATCWTRKDPARVCDRDTSLKRHGSAARVAPPRSLRTRGQRPTTTGQGGEP